MTCAFFVTYFAKVAVSRGPYIIADFEISNTQFGACLAWSSAGYLNNAVSEANPLHGLFVWFSEFASLVDPLVIFGQILIGLALLAGLFFRFAVLMGAVQMLFFWTAAWQGGIVNYPL